MKRKFISLILVLLLCAGLAATALAAPEMLVLDEADILTSSEESTLAEKLQRVSDEYGAQILVVTVSGVSGGGVDRYVEYLYDSMDCGYGADRDGVLLLVCMNPREYRILSNGFAADAIDYYEIDAIGSAIVSDLSDGYYYDAFDTFADQCAYYLDGHINGFPFDFGKNLLIALAVGLGVGLIVVFILKGQLKSVRRQSRADVYTKENSMRLNVSRELFLYRNVSRRRRENNNSSRPGGSGGSRRVGGGSF